MLYNLILDGHDVDVHALILQLEQKDHYSNVTIQHQNYMMDVIFNQANPILEGNEISKSKQ
jgi:hypothetical protein